MQKAPSFLPETSSLPLNETPSYRLAEKSAEYLSDTELLSLILKGTMDSARSLETARNLLSCYGGLKRLAALSLRELQRFPGIGPGRACAIQSALALSRRLNRPDGTPVSLSSPREAADYMQGILSNLPQEEFHALLLDTKHHLIANRMITRGLVDRSQVHAREVFRAAIAENSSRIILCHNHPSGDPSPSAQDIACTRNLVSAGAIIGIDILDHVIIGSCSASGCCRYVSLREENLLKADSRLPVLPS